MGNTRFCIFVTTLCDGPGPVEFDADNKPITYSDRESAERVIAADAIERWHQYLSGEREFDDAATIEEYVNEVLLTETGAVVSIEG